MTNIDRPGDPLLGRNILLVASAAIPSTLVFMDGAPTWLLYVAPLLTLVLLGISVHVNFVQPRIRRQAMKRPFRIYFRNAGDGGETQETTLHVSAHSRVHIQINRVILATHTQHLLMFGIDGPPNLKPRIIDAENRLIEDGLARHRSPATSEDHMVLDFGDYHIRQQATLTKDNVASSGYTLQTRSEGTYRLKMSIMTEFGLGKSLNELSLVVGPADVPTERPPNPQAP